MNKGTLKVVRGDVTSPQLTSEDEIAIIPHCCNNLGAMGAAVAKALREKWPLVYEVYKIMEAESPKGLKNRLGENNVADVDDNIIVVNMIGQNGTVGFDNTKPVKYWALMKCMGLIRTDIMATLHMYPEYNTRKAVIHTPKFGSDLAGGNWYFILDLIREQWLDCGIDVVVYEFESDREKFGEVDEMDLVRAEEVELYKRLKELKDERVRYTQNQFKTPE